MWQRCQHKLFNMASQDFFASQLSELEAKGNLRVLPQVEFQGKWVVAPEGRMLNLSSNDYLGIAHDEALRSEFLESRPAQSALFSSTSSRLLTGNYPIYDEVEECLARLYGAESALFFSSGYHMNTGILPAVADSKTLILADKLVHASIIDGLRLAAANSLRYRHQDYQQLEALLDKHCQVYERVIVVTESLFSMDGDVAPLAKLVDLKKKYGNVMLYVDEAHAVGARGPKGLGVAEEQGCIADIDFLCGTMGKAMGSMGAFVICSKTIRSFLVNKMRTLIFTTALPPIQMEWTRFVLSKIASMSERRQWLRKASLSVQDALVKSGFASPSDSHILPVIIGPSDKTILKAQELRRSGFYVLPIRPPTVPEGTSRLRISLTAAIEPEELDALIRNIKSL